MKQLDLLDKKPKEDIEEEDIEEENKPKTFWEIITCDLYAVLLIVVGFATLLWGALS